MLGGGRSGASHEKSNAALASAIIGSPKMSKSTDRTWKIVRMLSSSSSGTPLVRLPGGPKIDKVRDRASVEGSGNTGEHLPTAGIIEGAARELGKSFEIERRVSGATQGGAGKVPKLAADSRAAVSWKDVDDIDLDAPRNVLLTRWPTADEPHHLLRDRGDHVESVRSLQ